MTLSLWDVDVWQTEIYRRAGADPDEPLAPTALARALLGRDGVRVVPNGQIPRDAYLARVYDRWFICVRKGLSRERIRFAVAHELAEHALRGQVAEDIEQACNAIAAAVLAPRRAFTRRMNEVGQDWEQLALPFGMTQTAAALRAGEAHDMPLAVVSKIVRVRGPEAFVWPAEETVRRWARMPPPGPNRRREADRAGRRPGRRRRRGLLSQAPGEVDRALGVVPRLRVPVLIRVAAKGLPVAVQHLEAVAHLDVVLEQIERVVQNRAVAVRRLAAGEDEPIGESALAGVAHRGIGHPLRRGARVLLVHAVDQALSRRRSPRSGIGRSLPPHVDVDADRQGAALVEDGLREDGVDFRLDWGRRRSGSGKPHRGRRRGASIAGGRRLAAASHPEGNKEQDG